MIETAYAQGAAGAAANPLMSMLPLLAIMVIFYFLLIRPQQKSGRSSAATRWLPAAASSAK
jgi:preprotein translocase subunit YajC